MLDNAYAVLSLPEDNTLNAITRWVKEELSGFPVEGVEYVPAPLWHVTLVYAERVEELDVRQIAEMFSFQYVPIFADSFMKFSTDKDYLVLEVYPSEPLMSLQSILFGLFLTRGVISEFSIPANYNPHITLASFPKGTLSDELVSVLNVMIPVYEFPSIGAKKVTFATNDYTPIAITTAVEYKAKEAWETIVEKADIDLSGVERPNRRNWFKTFGDNNWLAWYSNNFEDREGEIISLNALREFTDEANKGSVPMPELWFHHIKGTRHGIAQALFLVDHFAMAYGVFDDPTVNKFVTPMKSWYDKQEFITVSHGFEYEAKDKTLDGVYQKIRTYEISSLPAGREANSLTRFMMRGHDERITERL